MKLNNDCIRDILLTLENGLVFYNGKPRPIKALKLISNETLRSNYSKDEIVYSIQYLLENNFIKQCNTAKANAANISDITEKGHKLLASISNNSHWKIIKPKLIEAGCTLGSFTADAIISTLIGNLL